MLVDAMTRSYGQSEGSPSRGLITGVFIALLIAGFTGLGAAYTCLKSLLGADPVDFPPVFMRVLAYWRRYPFEYIGVISLTYALVGSIWVSVFGRARSWARVAQISGVVMATGALSCLFCGILWAYQDMRAGYFPEYPRLLSHLRWGAVTGLMWGPSVLLVSLPLNVLAFGLYYLILDGVARFCLKDPPEHGPAQAAAGANLR